MAYQIIQQFCGNNKCKLKSNGKTVECSDQQTADVVNAPVGGTVSRDQSSGNITITTTTGEKWTLSKFDASVDFGRVVTQNQQLGKPSAGVQVIKLTLEDTQGNRDITPYWNYDQINQRRNQQTVPTASRFENQPQLWRNAVSAASAPQRIATQATVGLFGKGLKTLGQTIQNEQTLSNNNLDSLVLEEIERIKKLLK